jgi:hypothetical protein
MQVVRVEAMESESGECEWERRLCSWLGALFELQLSGSRCYFGFMRELTFLLRGRAY